MLDFENLYESYSSDIYRFAFWLAGNSTDAEDITSETFIKAWAGRGRIRTETLKAYLFTIARNVYLENLRKARNHIQLEDIYTDPSPGPDENAETNHELGRAFGIIRAFPEIARSAFIMRVQHELPYTEIARVLEISVTSAKVKVHRVRKRLIIDRLEKEADLL